ncbi:MAG: hypothetical protein EOO88_08390 [Pedobacter sp.]|nr:MAG: hypothetical protein EOO88_08390 [Pedobacter sp.]
MMKPVYKSVILAFLILSMVSFHASAQRSKAGADSVTLLIDTVLKFAEQKSLYRANVNWKTLGDTVRKAAAKAGSIKESMPAMKLFYTLLKDHHGFALYERKYYGWNPPRAKLDTTIYRALLKQMKQKNKPFARVFNNDYGYLSIPDNNPTQWGDNEKIATEIQQALAEIHPEKLKGLIIDLRLNPGGAMFPMLGGIMNVFADGKLGTFVDPVTKTGEEWGKRGNVIYDGDETAYTLTKTLPDLHNLHIVVLIGPNTGSSGEATAISLKGRKNTYFIGEHTSGYTTANSSIQFSYNTGIFLATSVEADRNGTVYLNHVKPDFQIIGGDNFTTLSSDKKVIAGLEWLKAHNRSWLLKVKDIVGELVFNSDDR